jgi:hypothetical protein
MKNIILLIGVATLLQGCGTTGVNGENVIGRPGSPLWFGTASRATINAHYKENCRDYGFKDGTPEMAQCMQTELRTGRQGSSDRFTNALNKFNDSMKPAPTVRTNCTSWGRTINCTSR